MANQELTQYIKSQLDAGVSKQQIIEALVPYGWIQADIDAAFNAATGTVSPQQETQVAQTQQVNQQPQVVQGNQGDISSQNNMQASVTQSVSSGSGGGVTSPQQQNQDKKGGKKKKLLLLLIPLLIILLAGIAFAAMNMNKEEPQGEIVTQKVVEEEKVEERDVKEPVENKKQEVVLEPEDDTQELVEEEQPSDDTEENVVQELNFDISDEDKLQSTGQLGITPGMINLKSIFRGQKIDGEFSIIRSKYDFNQAFEVVIKGEYADRVILAPEVFTPKGSEITKIPFQIDTNSMLEGEHTVTIQFLPKLYENVVGGNGAGSAIRPAVAGGVRFTVTGEVVEKAEVENLMVEDTEERSNLSFSYSATNSGNVDWRPSKVKMLFVDQFDETNIIEKVIDAEKIDIVKPGAIKKVVHVSVDHGLSEGNYLATVQVFGNSEEVLAEISQEELDVYPRGTLNQKADLTGVSSSKSTYKPNELISVNAEIENKGDVPVDSIVIIEINNGDELIDIVRGRELSVSSGETVALRETLKIQDEGEYELGVYVEYGSKITNTLKLPITISSSLSGNSQSDQVGSDGSVEDGDSVVASDVSEDTRSSNSITDILMSGYGVLMLGILVVLIIIIVVIALKKE